MILLSVHWVPGAICFEICVILTHLNFSTTPCYDYCPPYTNEETEAERVLVSS